MRAFKRWMTLGMVAASVAGLTLARPARAEVPNLVQSSGLASNFDLHFSSAHENGVHFVVDAQDAEGNFAGRIKRGTITTAVTGQITAIDAASEARGSFKITFSERLFLTVRTYDAVLQVEPLGPGEEVQPFFCRFFMAGSYSVKNVKGQIPGVQITPALFPKGTAAMEGTFPFCGSGVRFLIGG